MIQTSSWVIDGRAAGLNFREGKKGTTFTDRNPFIPHFVTPDRSAKFGDTTNIQISRKQKRLYENIYPEGYNTDIYDGRFRFRLSPSYSANNEEYMLYSKKR